MREIDRAVKDLVRKGGNSTRLMRAEAVPERVQNASDMRWSVLGFTCPVRSFAEKTQRLITA